MKALRKILLIQLFFMTVLFTADLLITMKMRSEGKQLVTQTETLNEKEPGI